MGSPALLFLAGVFISAGAQVLLKKSAMRAHASRWGRYLNPLVLGGYSVFLAATVLSLLAYRAGLPLKSGPVLGSSSYFFVAAFGRVFFGERISHRKLAGLALIAAGTWVFFR